MQSDVATQCGNGSREISGNEKTLLSRAMKGAAVATTTYLESSGKQEGARERERVRNRKAESDQTTQKEKALLWVFLCRSNVVVLRCRDYPRSTKNGHKMVGLC